MRPVDSAVTVSLAVLALIVSLLGSHEVTFGLVMATAGWVAHALFSAWRWP